MVIGNEETAGGQMRVDVDLLDVLHRRDGDTSSLEMMHRHAPGQAGDLALSTSASAGTPR